MVLRLVTLASMIGLAVTAGQAVSVTPAGATNYGQGYTMFGADGGAFAFGKAGFYGTISTIPGGGGTPQSWFGSNIVAGAVSPTRDGYWFLAANGYTCVRGNALAENNQWTADNVKDWCATVPAGVTYAGSVNSILGIDNGGYLIVTSIGACYAYGDTSCHGNAPGGNTIVAATATTDGLGYWMVSATGAVFAFGDAFYKGGISVTLNKPIVGIAPDASASMAPGVGNFGYWLVASDGGLFPFNAPFLGSVGNTALPKPITGIVGSGSGLGYLMTASDGGGVVFGDFAFQGAMSGNNLASSNSPPNNIVGVGGS